MPNKMPEFPPEFMSYVPARQYSEKYKFHMTEKDARAALKIRRNYGQDKAKVYQWAGQKWVELE